MAMSKPVAAEAAHAFGRSDEPVILSPEQEDELEQVIAETDEDERAGRGITWAQFLEERGTRRAR